MVKARKAIFAILQALVTSGNVSVPLAMKLFISKIEPILTYGSVIWGIERNNNYIVREGLKGSNQVNLKEKVVRIVQPLFGGETKPNLEVIKRLGRKNNENSRNLLVKFVHYSDKEKVSYSEHCNTNFLSIEGGGGGGGISY